MAFQTGIVDALDPLRLRLLVEVQRRGSISAAAEACRVSQPSATKHLKTVEAALGEKLVERNGRASALTDAGRIVAAHAARALDTLDGMSEELDALRGAERGRLALAASTTPGTYVLPSILQCFADRHPRVEVEVMIGSSTWVAERVARREVSLALAGEVDWPDGVRPEPFLEDEVVGISAPGQLRLRRGKASASELADHTLLTREPGSSSQGIAERSLARTGYRPAKRWELDSNEAIKRSVQAGLGVGFVSRLAVEEELERGELVAFRVDGAGSMRRSVHLLLPDDRDSTPSERAFIATLSDCCAVSVAGCTVDTGTREAGC
ncbi:MAG TPA: LysR substrate-binding domain-containing protein [Solirubrobacterales bacterium]|nr:LysR substrate-binding domain-containing protein [Solirubrobacterales bacterium]